MGGAGLDRRAEIPGHVQAVGRRPGGLLGRDGRRIDWIKPYTKVKAVSYDPRDVSIRWYEDGTLNACVNCVDRHLRTRGDQTAIIWEGDDPTRDEKITYRSCTSVCRSSPTC